MNCPTPTRNKNKIIFTFTPEGKADGSTTGSSSKTPGDAMAFSKNQLIELISLFHVILISPFTDLKHSLVKLMTANFKSLVKKSNPDRFILMISVLIFGIHPIHVEQNLRLHFTKTLIALKYD